MVQPEAYWRFELQVKSQSMVFWTLQEQVTVALRNGRVRQKVGIKGKAPVQWLFAPEIATSLVVAAVKGMAMEERVVQVEAMRQVELVAQVGQVAVQRMGFQPAQL